MLSASYHGTHEKEMMKSNHVTGDTEVYVILKKILIIWVLTRKDAGIPKLGKYKP